MARSSSLQEDAGPIVPCVAQGGEVMASTTTGSNPLAKRADNFRDAYLARDVDRMTDQFAEDAELTAAPGVFRGKEAIRHFLAWDADLSPTVTVEDVGLGLVPAGDHAVAWERVLHLTYEGIPYHEDAVTVLEFDDEGRICRYRSYYDKLAVVDQIAAGLPGVAGWFTQEVVKVVVAAGSLGLEA
jgi:ketosteroid isomerase-like protein